MKTIFVSSTFQDMQTERDAIRDLVAPVINSEAHEHGDHVDFCDLRWGIDTRDYDTDAGTQKVLDICFREIDRSDPPMIVILGNRYGWVPDAKIVSRTAEINHIQLDDLEKSITALEIEYGSILKKRNTFVYVRKLEGDNIPSVFASENEMCRLRLENLISRLESMTNNSVKTYSMRVSGTGFSSDDVSAFANLVINDLRQSLMPEWDKREQLTPFEREMGIQWNYVENKRKMFKARSADFDECMNLIENAKESVIVCKGDSGSGKSTILSNVAIECKKKGMHVLPEIGGLTENSNDALDILLNEIYYAEDVLSIPHSDVQIHFNEDDIVLEEIHVEEERIQALQQRLRDLSRQLADRNKTMLIAVDALDQLFPNEYRDNLIFIPKGLSDSIRFFLTCTTDYELTYKSNHVLLPLDKEDKRRVVSGICNVVGKELSNEVLPHILEAAGSENPLFISLIVSRLLMMDAEDFLEIKSSGSEINTAIAEKQISIIDHCSNDIEMLSVDVFSEVGKRINPKLAEIATKYIAMSRLGLRIEDLAVLCGDYWNQLDFSRLVNYLQDHFLLRDDGRYDFFHKSIRNGFRVASNKNGETEGINKVIAHYLEKLAEEDPIRKKELIYHIIRSSDNEQFISFIKKYSHSDDNSYINNAAAVCHEICIRDDGQYINDILDYLNEDCVEVIQFVCGNLQRAFSDTKSEYEISKTILMKAEDVFNGLMNNIPDSVRWQILSDLYFRLAYISNYMENYADAYKYAELYLNVSKCIYGPHTSVEDRVRMYRCYYEAIVQMKSNHDQDALHHTLEVAQEGLDMMDEESWEYYYTNYPVMLPYVDCMGEMYGNLEDLDMCLKTYERGIDLREKYYIKHQSKYNLCMTSGAYFNVASAEMRYDTYSHHLRAFEMIKKDIDISETTGLAYAMEDIETYSAEFGGRTNLIHHMVFCARGYLLAFNIASLISKESNDNEKIRCEQIEWIHKAMDLLLYAYQSTRLPLYRRDLLSAGATMEAVVAYKTEAEYKEYEKKYIQWLDITRNALFEDPTEDSSNLHFTILILISEILKNSEFPGSRQMAISMMYDRGRKGLEISGKLPQKLIDYDWYRYCFETIRNIILTADPTINESYVTKFIDGYIDIFGNEDSITNTEELFNLEMAYMAAGNYYYINQSLPYSDIKALTLFEKCVTVNKRILEQDNNENYIQNMAEAYYAAARCAYGIDMRNPLWKMYISRAKEIYTSLLESKKRKQCEFRIREIDQVLSETQKMKKSENEYTLEAFTKAKVNQSDENVSKLLLWLVKTRFIAIAYMQASRAGNVEELISETEFFCCKSVTGKLSLPVFIDAVTADRFILKMSDKEQYEKIEIPFKQVCSIVTNEAFEGILLNPNGGLAIPSDSIIEASKFVEEHYNKPAKSKVTNQKFATMTSIIAELKEKFKYNDLKMAKDARDSISDAVSSYAVGIDTSKVIAVVETGKKGLLKKKAEGILFTEDSVCSSYFPIDMRVVDYVDIEDVKPCKEGVSIRHKNRRTIVAPIDVKNALFLSVISGLYKNGKII